MMVALLLYAYCVGVPFLLRGLAKVRGEWSLITLTHNLLKLHGAPAMA